MSIDNRFVITEVNLDSRFEIFVSKSGNEYYRKKDDPNFTLIKPTGQLESNKLFYLKYYKDDKDKYPNKFLQFSISHFYQLTINKRIHVIIFCNDHETGFRSAFTCYTSISDGSFWRYCIKDSTMERYEKGYNYISSSFINIYLQRFISFIINKYSILPYQLNTIQCQTDKELDDKIKDRILNYSGSHPIFFFRLVDEIFPPVTYLINYKERLILLIDIIRKIINMNDSDVNFKLRHVSNLFCFLNDVRVNQDIGMSTETSQRDYFNKVRLVLTKFFNYYFTIKAETIIEIMEKEFNVGELTFTSKIYAVNALYKPFDEEYIIYYMKYKMNSIDYKNILHIIPVISKGKRNTINMWGLDTSYVAGGPYINKIFDYTQQAPLEPIRGHSESESANYRFIGDLTNFSFLP
jgi:hypothetical protein